MNPLNKLIVDITTLMPKKFVKLFANRYIAGITLSDVIEKVRQLNEKNILSTVDVLGESVSDRKEAEKMKDACIDVLNAIDNYNLKANLSIKLTSLALTLDYEYCKSLVSEILQTAKQTENFVRIDMEDSSVTDATIKMYEEMRKTFDNTGLVLQAYLRRTESDALRLMKEKSNFRLCKGIYIEPAELAFKQKQEIRDNYLKLLRLMFENKAYVGIATHDSYLIEGAKELIKEFSLTTEQYEFQMLLGVRENLRDSIVQSGNRLRVYTPFGERWYEYSIRRFKENPNFAGQVAKSIFTGGR